MINSVNIPPPNHIKTLDNNQGWIGLINHMGDESTITNAARVSFGKIKDKFDNKDEELLIYLIKNKHLTPLEHVKFTFIVHCPLFVRSQWHRHRTWAFNEISRRYTEVGIEVYRPSVYRAQSNDNKQASTDLVIDDNDRIQNIANSCMDECFATYEKMISAGVSKEQARGILPQNLMTTYWATVDLRNLLHFIELRDDSHAQKEIREYASATKELARPFVPHVIKYFEETKRREM